MFAIITRYVLRQDRVLDNQGLGKVHEEVSFFSSSVTLVVSFGQIGTGNVGAGM